MITAYTHSWKWDGCQERPPEGTPVPKVPGSFRPSRGSEAERGKRPPEHAAPPFTLLEPRAVVKSLHVNSEDLNQNVGTAPLAKDREQARSAPRSDVGRGESL